MRVALLATSYPTTPGDPSGHFVRAEALDLARRGHEVHVVAPAPRGDDIFSIHPCGASDLFAWPGSAARLRESPRRALSLPFFAARVTRAIRRIDPEVLYAHWAVPCGWPLGLWAAPRALELTSHGADVRLLLRMPSAVRAAITERLLAARRWRFVASELRLRLLEALPASLATDLERCSTVEPPLVSVEERRPLGQRPFPTYALTLGRLVAGKRTELAIRAVAGVAGLGLVVVGDGPERGRLEVLAQRILPGRCYFPGKVPREEALGYLEGALVLLHPSEEEAAPTAVLEALALGVPVLASDAGDLRDWASRNRVLRVLPPEPGTYSTELLALLGVS